MQTVFGMNLLSLEGDLVAVARSEKATIFGTRKIKIECPVGTTVGYLVTEPAWTRPNFLILDSKENSIFSVLSPWSAVFGSFKTAKFNIVSSVDKET
uniref:Uncharacterized protein n=1 Tax=Romanomermis culicivorax TaxID=13658 RepID=A0A915L3G8_ROMCU